MHADAKRDSDGVEVTTQCNSRNYHLKSRGPDGGTALIGFLRFEIC